MIFFLVALVSSVAATRQRPTMGWSTWCTNSNGSLPFVPCLNDFCSEDEVKGVAVSMVQNGLVSLGYNTLLLDDCWAATSRDPTTKAIRADQSRFPSGTLAPLAAYLRTLGLRLGAYTDVGEKTCRGGRLGSWPHYDLDAKTFAAWGLQLVKMDWCGHPAPYTQQQLYSNFSRALNATGADIEFNICGWGLDNVWTWGGAIATSYRIGPDHLPILWTPPTPQDPGHGQGLLNVIDSMRGLSRFEGVADPDFLEPGYWWNGENLDRIEFSFWCLWGAPLMVATDVRKPSKVLFNNEAIAVNQDALLIAGDAVSPPGDHAQIWTKQLSGGRWAALLFNSDIFAFGSRTPALSLNATHLHNWPAGKQSAVVRDLWAHRTLGTFTGTFSKQLDALEFVFVTLTPV